jgi:hypothetical protein
MQAVSQEMMFHHSSLRPKVCPLVPEKLSDREICFVYRKGHLVNNKAVFSYYFPHLNGRFFFFFFFLVSGTN